MSKKEITCSLKRYIAREVHPVLTPRGLIATASITAVDLMSIGASEHRPGADRLLETR